MKIQINNFGPINKFEVDLTKDLIAVYGKNNIGKSYALSLIYLLIKNLSIFRSQLSQYPILISPNKSNDLKKLIEERAEDWLYIYFITNLVNSIKQSFGTIINQHTQKQVNISISNKNIILNIKINKKMAYFIDFDINYNIQIKDSNRREKFFEKDNNITLYLKSNSNYDEVIKEFILAKLIDFTENLSIPLFLPASRSGLYQSMNSFNQIFAELSQKKLELKSKIGIPTYTEPVADFYLSLTSIRSNHNDRENKFSKLIHKIEKNILHGSIEFNQERKELFFQDNESKLNLALSQTSSMVSELAPFVGLIKFPHSDKLNSNFIFIEEPEVHLHPEIQVKLSEIFVELINSGCKIIMISHSNYIFNKLNNLVLEGKLDNNKYAPYILEQTENGSITKLMKIDELGVEDENFTDVSEKLYNERMQIIDKLNKESNEKK